MRVRHARQTGVSNNPTKPGHLGGGDWDGDHVVELTEPDIPAEIARLSALTTLYQAKDSDLDAIAALSTTAYGRSLLALADAAAGRTALGLGEGASFPGSPAANDRFFRTDRGREYYYDGTRWLSSQEFPVALSILDGLQPTTGSPSSILYGITDQGENGMYVTRWKASSLILTTNDASNFWTVQLVSSGAGDTNLGASFSTAADGTSYAPHTVTVGAVVNAAHTRLQVKVTKTGAPTGIYMIAGAFYRLIG